MRSLRFIRLVRIAAVMVAVTALIGVAAERGWRFVGAALPRPLTFDELLVRGAGVALLACLGWLWLALMATAWEAAHPADPGGRLRIETAPSRLPSGLRLPVGVRRVVFALCGVGLTLTTTPALAMPAVEDPAPSPSSLVADLPFPGRAVGQAGPPSTPPPTPQSAGDTPASASTPVGSSQPEPDGARLTPDPGPATSTAQKPTKSQRGSVTAPRPSALSSHTAAADGAVGSESADPAAPGSRYVGQEADAPHGAERSDRTDGVGSAARDAPSTTVVVSAGDSLWSIAAALVPLSSTAQVDQGWRELYALNQAVIGDDPSLIQPGMHLNLPRSLQ